MANPIDFLNAPDKERVLLLLAALPIELDSFSLWNSMGIERTDIGPIPDGLHPLQELTLIREAVFRERTGVNRDAKQKADSAEQTRRAAPAAPPEEIDQEILQLAEEVSVHEVELSAAIATARAASEKEIEVIKSDVRSAINERKQGTRCGLPSCAARPRRR
jgi:hypothetical protein